VLASNSTIYEGSSGFNRNAAGSPRSYGAIDCGKSRSISVNVLYHLSNERVALEREADMHDIASRDRRGQIDVNTERLVPALQDLQQRFADLPEADDDDNLLHSLETRFLTTKLQSRVLCSSRLYLAFERRRRSALFRDDSLRRS
jgi:hypothetical protein